MSDPTLKRMQQAIFDVEAGRSPHRTFIESNVAVANEMVAEVTAAHQLGLAGVAKVARSNSERWFPFVHSPDALCPLEIHYALGLAGEAGEVANLAKKSLRSLTDRSMDDEIAGELADVFTYLILLADEVGVDLLAAFSAKQNECERRWGGQS